jgi:hypothetical protein
MMTGRQKFWGEWNVSPTYLQLKQFIISNATQILPQNETFIFAFKNSSAKSLNQAMRDNPTFCDS